MSIQACSVSLRWNCWFRATQQYVCHFVQLCHCLCNNFGEIKRIIMKMCFIVGRYTPWNLLAFVLWSRFVIKTAVQVFENVNQRKSLITTSAHIPDHRGQNLLDALIKCIQIVGRVAIKQLSTLLHLQIKHLHYLCAQQRSKVNRSGLS